MRGEVRDWSITQIHEFINTVHGGKKGTQTFDAYVAKMGREAQVLFFVIIISTVMNIYR